MAGKTKSTRTADGPRGRIRLERTFQAPIEDVWELWTTKEGIESWWGPDGFYVTVRTLDLRPGGLLEYTMIAKGAEQIAFMKAAGAPLETHARATFREIVPLRRLAYDHVVDFLPDAKPYDVLHVVELHAGPEGVRMVLTFDAMHSDQQTMYAEMGWTSEFEKLEKALESRRGGGAA